MASATARLGHSWQVQVGQFWRAPKSIRQKASLSAEDYKIT